MQFLVFSVVERPDHPRRGCALQPNVDAPAATLRYGCPKTPNRNAVAPLFATSQGRQGVRINRLRSGSLLPRSPEPREGFRTVRTCTDREISVALFYACPPPKHA